MGEKYLFNIFIEEEVDDLREILAYEGAIGLLTGFEIWLQRRDIINEDTASELRKKNNIGEITMPLSPSTL